MKKSIRNIFIAVLVLTILAAFPIVAGAAGTKAIGAATVEVNDYLNIRNAPADGNVIGTIGAGEIVVVYDNKTNPEWYRINYHGIEGYVSADYLSSVLSAENFDADGIVNASYVRMRSGPSTDNDVLDTLSTDDEVAIIGINNGWFKIRYDGQTGYMSSEYITITDGSGYDPTPPPVTPPEEETGETTRFTDTIGKVTGDYVRFRSASTLNSTVLFTLDRGTHVNINSLFTLNNSSWYNVDYNGNNGYMSADYIELVKDTQSGDLNEEAYVSGNYVRFRSGPSTDSSIIATLGNGTAITVISKDYDGWYKISYNGKIGYMYAAYITSGSYIPPTYCATFGEAVAQYALQFVGYDYVYGGASPSEGFDCSGLVKYVYETGFGVLKDSWFPHGATSQWNSGLFYQVARDEVQPGDLIYFSSDPTDGITHIGLFIGNGQFVHASTSTTGVIISDYYSDYYTEVFYGAQRLKDEYIPNEYK